MATIEWEHVTTKGFETAPIKTWRSKVFGGWLVTPHGHKEMGITFVPDPNHEWK
jgi:hypothetical protein